ncbi:terminase large subunit [Microvirga tunisiensis]|uniref:Terminase large subunit n=1 Tax=Pannonibacter tanglangensis TaxID=2750084 RepID=A0A7X5F2V2_9HYPH|nr:terminase large subunit [Pannonibacter sp. XCT-53]NBN78688.1 terminase large subunit [Pannonibacter sp. XCT-53]
MTARGWSTACPDWKDRIINRRPLIPDLPLFDAEAERALRVFKRLRVPDIIGQPTYGEVCDEWVFALVRAIFGSFDVKTQRRMIREFFVLIPKKNGKSSIAAAIMVTAAILNVRPEAELLLIAPTKKIAEIAFKQAVGIIRLDKDLNDLLKPQNHQKTITHLASKAVIAIKAAEADVITGSKATFILIDETHVFAMKSKAAEIFVEIRGSLASRPDGFLLQITTQSKTPPTGVFRDELDIARKVRDGDLDLPLLPVLYELPFEVANDNGWRDPKTWGMVNPNLNRSVDERFLRDELTKAEAKGTAALLLFASQHLNVEVGQSLGGWRGSHYWAKQRLPELSSLDALLEMSEVVTVGIDGGGLDDLLGVSVLGRHKVTQHWLCWSHAFAQRDVLLLRQEIAQALQDFERDGDLTFCDDATSDIAGVADICRRVRDSGLLPDKYGVGLDPMGVAALVDELARSGIGGDLVTGVSQGFRLSSAVWGLERKLKDGTLWHGGQGLLSWCVGNARAEQRGNAVLITKETAGKSKIDPLVALFNAVKLMEVGPSAGGVAATSPWDDPDFSLVA